MRFIDLSDFFYYTAISYPLVLGKSLKICRFLKGSFQIIPLREAAVFLFGKVFFDALDKTESDLQAIRNKAVKEGAKAVNVKAASKGEVREQARYAKQGGEWSDALTGAEWAKYNNAITSGVGAGLRISDNAMLVECEEDNIYQYKLVIYDSTFEDNPIINIYAISNIDYNIDDARMIAEEIDDLEASGYGQKYAKKILKSIAKVHKIFFGKYNSKNPAFSRIGNYAPKNGANSQQQSNGTATYTTAGQIKFSDRIAQSDTDYLAAVERGDMETAQRMLNVFLNICFNNLRQYRTIHMCGIALSQIILLKNTFVI